jgi:hypothetical protein
MVCNSEPCLLRDETDTSSPDKDNGDASVVGANSSTFGGQAFPPKDCLLTDCNDKLCLMQKETSPHGQLEDGTTPVRNILALACTMDGHKHHSGIARGLAFASMAGSQK